MELLQKEQDETIATLRKNHYAIYLAKMTKKIEELRQNSFLSKSQKKFQLQVYNEILKDRLLQKLKRLDERICAAPPNMANPRFYLEEKKTKLLEDLRLVMEMYHAIRDKVF